MAKILTFGHREAARPDAAGLAGLVDGFSIEVMPRTAARVADFTALLPAGTRVYVAHIEGVPMADMRDTCARLIGEGFEVMPHIPARGLRDARDFEARLDTYRALGVTGALVLAGGNTAPEGPYFDSMQLLRSGLFDRYGFTRLHVAGHPEGNRDIDPEGGERAVMRALKWKSDFQARTDARMAIATQFAFEAAPIADWCARLRAHGITLPVHVGIAGPAKLQTLVRFAMACGVGPSLQVLQRRAADLTALVRPFEPTALLTDLAARKAAAPDLPIAGLHFFPLGGIGATASYIAALTAEGGQRAHG